MASPAPPQISPFRIHDVKGFFHDELIDGPRDTSSPPKKIRKFSSEQRRIFNEVWDAEERRDIHQGYKAIAIAFSSNLRQGIVLDDLNKKLYKYHEELSKIGDPSSPLLNTLRKEINDAFKRARPVVRGSGQAIVFEQILKDMEHKFNDATGDGQCMVRIVPLNSMEYRPDGSAVAISSEEDEKNVKRIKSCAIIYDLAFFVTGVAPNYNLLYPNTLKGAQGVTAQFNQPEHANYWKNRYAINIWLKNWINGSGAADTPVKIESFVDPKVAAAGSTSSVPLKPKVDVTFNLSSGGAKITHTFTLTTGKVYQLPTDAEISSKLTGGAATAADIQDYKLKSTAGLFEDIGYDNVYLTGSDVKRAKLLEDMYAANLISPSDIRKIISNSDEVNDSHGSLEAEFRKICPKAFTAADAPPAVAGDGSAPSPPRRPPGGGGGDGGFVPDGGEGESRHDGYPAPPPSPRSPGA